MLKKIYKNMTHVLLLVMILFMCGITTSYATGAGTAPVTTQPPANRSTPAPTTPKATATPKPVVAPDPKYTNPPKTPTPSPKASGNTGNKDTPSGSIDSYLSKDKWSASDVKNMVKLLQTKGDFAQKKAINSLVDSYEDSTTAVLAEIFNSVGDMNLMGGTNFSYIYDLFALIGYALITLYFVIALIEKASTAQMSIEQFFHILLKVVIAKVVIENGWSFISSFYSAGLSVAKGIQTVAFNVGGSSITDASYLAMAGKVREIAENGYFANIFASFDFSPMAFICNIVCFGIAAVVVWGLVIEIVVKSILAPLAFAEIVTSGIHGSGMRYLKRLFMLDLQFAAILLTTFVCNSVKNQLTITGNGSMNAQIILNLVMVFSIIKASSYVNELSKG